MNTLGQGSANFGTGGQHLNFAYIRQAARLAWGKQKDVYPSILGPCVHPLHLQKCYMLFDEITVLKIILFWRRILKFLYFFYFWSITIGRRASQKGSASHMLPPGFSLPTHALRQSVKFSKSLHVSL